MTAPPFIDDDFLLESATARDLYHGFAESLPIIDYHTHLPPRQIAENHRFRTLTELWLEGDHYKWRAMRTSGVAERYCTGDASPWEKFEAWAKTVPETLRNPLYHWTHMELATPLGSRSCPTAAPPGSRAPTSSWRKTIARSCSPGLAGRVCIDR
jgi:glucuronate isomerase